MEDFTKAAVLEDESEALLLESILIERDIPHLIRSYYDTSFDGLFQSQKGWGYVSAPLSHHGEIVDILQDLRSAVGFSEVTE